MGHKISDHRWTRLQTYTSLALHAHLVFIDQGIQDPSVSSREPFPSMNAIALDIIGPSFVVINLTQDHTVADIREAAHR